jgi:DNA (cytosine-5)-methyltransferase 1
MSDLVIDPFAGPGGWSWAARQLGIDDIGIELDAAACATRAAAGLKTICADVAGFGVDHLAGKVWGLISSPPCTTFSAAGKRAGTAVADVLEAMILDQFEGSKTRAAHRREMARMLRMAWWPNAKMTRAERSAAIWKAVRSASLVAEPARFIYACHPEWVALEQVPAVLPLWQVYAAELRRMGYSAWTGTLNAADYGVPQVRERAFLIASRVSVMSRPEPTHYDPRKGGQLWGEPWITMADALGWGMTGRPYFTLPTAGGDRGGADVGGSGARRALYAERDAGRWVYERPATTVLADPRLGRPGHKGRERGGEAHFAVGSVRLTPAQAAVLQSFPADYPFAGPATKAHQQIGNAVPPLLAEHVLSMATGIKRMEAAA